VAKIELRHDGCGGVQVSDTVMAHDELTRQIIDIFVKEGPIDREKLKPETTLKDLNLESLDVVTVMMAVEDKFGVYFPMDSTLVEAKNFDEFVRAVAAHVAKERA
jgi:acyl carrier protein